MTFGESIMFWLAAAIVKNFFAFLMLLALLGWGACLAISAMTRQMRCQHLTYRETSACDAICCKCGMNLGFIQTQREKNPGGER